MSHALKEVCCYNCQKALELTPSQKILRHEECEHCSVHLHVCKMCEFYDETAYNECREPLAERILEKEKANFCSYFVLKGGKGSEGESKEDIMAAANALFKK